MTEEELQQLRMCRSSYSRYPEVPRSKPDIPWGVYLCVLGSTVFLMAVLIGLMMFA